MKRSLTLATFIAFAAAAYAPLPSMAQSQYGYSVVVSSAPPAPLYEAVPAPRRGYVWAPGHWEWRGHRHEWVQGYWIAERPGYVYSAPTWYRSDRGWAMRPASWDRDGDGIPDRMEYRRGDRDWDRDRGWDRDRDWERRHEARRWDQDRDGIPNRYDRDRDGDGVPNWRDRAPDDWRRR